MIEEDLDIEEQDPTETESLFLQEWNNEDEDTIVTTRAPLTG